MIIIIAGTANTGKTYISNLLMKELSIPYFPIDYLMMGIFRSNNNCGYTPESDVKIINSNIWPIVLEMIKTSIENNHSMIFEGYQILPKDIVLIPEDYRKNIKTIFICFSTNYIIKNYNKICEYRSVIEKRTDIETKEEMIKKTNELISDCKKNNINIKIIENQYEDEIGKIVNEIRLTTAST